MKYDAETVDTGKSNPLLVKLQTAREGIQVAWLEDLSFRRQVYGALAMLMLLLITRPMPIWWAVCAVATLTVLGLEVLNGALERLADHVQPSHHPAIKTLKDMAAGAVIIGNVSMAAVGLALLANSAEMF